MMSAAAASLAVLFVVVPPADRRVADDRRPATTSSTGHRNPGVRCGCSSWSSCCRCLATAATVAGGGVGGLFVPLVVAGALAGAAVAGIVNDADLSLFIVIGVAAFLGAGYRVPLAAVMFVAETTGRPASWCPACWRRSPPS